MNTAERNATVPGWAVAAHALGVLAAFGLYCGLMYVLVRPLFGSFGFDLVHTVKSVVAVGFLGCFVFFLIPIVDLPLIWFRHLRPRSRAKRGCCPNCGQPAPPGVSQAVCPECGTTPQPPAAWRPDAGTLRRFLLLLLGAIAIGSSVGEWALVTDERRFRREALQRAYAAPTDSYSRPRSWPNGHARLTYTPETGLEATSFISSDRMRRRRSKGS